MGIVQECINEINKINIGNNKFGSFTWSENTGGSYSKMCYASYGDGWYPVKSNDNISGHLGGLYCTRKFEHCYVELDVFYYTANITWF